MSVLAYLRPLLPSRADYRDLARTWRGDLIAGVTVGIVALPLALAFGVSSVAGAAAGLVPAIVAGIVAAVFGGPHVQVSCPNGAMVLVLVPIVTPTSVRDVTDGCLLSGFFLLVVAPGTL